VPLLLIFVRTRPVGAPAQSAAQPADALLGCEVREALHTRAFWMLVVVQLSYGLAIGGTFHHLVAFLEGLSYSLHSATLVVSIVLGMAAIGKAAMGVLGDRIGGKNALAIGFVMIAAGIFILLNAGRTTMLVLWLIVIGIAGAAPIALVPMVTAETLGLKRFGTLFGWLGTVVTVGLFLGPLLVGWLTDVTGSYTTPFELCALISLVGATAAFLCVAPRPSEIPLIAKASTSTSTI
jgi:MFS family permease